MTANDKLLRMIRSRQEKRTQFNYGILTADRYVKTVQEAVGLDFCYRHMSKSTASFSDLMQKAASTLVYSNEDMVVDDSREGLDEIELPKNCLMVFRHVLTTPRKDRDGDILRTEGMIPDPKMLLIWQHVHTMPIGKMLAKVEHNSKVLRLVSCIVDMNSLCHDAAVMVDNKMGRFSHGFRAIKFGKVKEAPGEAEGGFDIKEAEIMEESLVSVPANPDAETEEVLLSLVEGGKLTSPVMKRVGKRIRERRPVCVPVQLDLKVSVNGQEISNVEGQGKSAGGGSTGAPEEADEGHEENPKGEKGQAADPQVKGIVPYGQLPGSWEYIGQELRSKAEKFLADAGKIKSTSADQPRNYWVGIVATYSDYCIVGIESMSASPPDTYYKCKWQAGPDGKPEFSGDPKEVEVSISTTIREKGLLAKARAAWDKAKADPKEDDEDEEEKESQACPKCGSEDIKDGVCQDCGYELEDGEKPDEDEDEKPSKSAASGEKKGRVLSRDNEGKIKEAMEYLDEGHKMDGVPKPCKACIGHARGNLKTVLDTLGADGEASPESVIPHEITVDEAAVLFIAAASPGHRAKMLELLKGMERIDEMEKNTKEFLALKGR